MGGGFTADPAALRAEAGRFMQESETLARLVGSLGGAGRATTGDGALDGLIARLLDEITTSAGSAGMALEDDGGGLIVNAANYEAADQSSVSQPAGP
jgi:hypothetical protein